MLASLSWVSGLALAFTLGLRHGLDPDHISAIDAMTLRSLDHRAHTAPWTGTLFALGHGSVVTLMAVAISLMSRRIQLPGDVLAIAEWVPITFLLVVGVLNLRGLLRPHAYQIAGWKAPLLPKRLRESSRPWAAVLVGVAFAIAFDTATQAMAWGYAATSNGGALLALLIGASFTSGMILTDSLDSRLMCALLRRATGAEDAERYRRAVGALVVMLSFGVAGYEILIRALPLLEVNGNTFTLVGLSLLLGLLAAFWGIHPRRQSTKA